MVAGLLDVVGHHVFKRQHALDIHVARAGDQVSLVGVLAGQLKADQVAAVVQIAAVYEVVFGILPAGRVLLFMRRQNWQNAWKMKGR